MEQAPKARARKADEAVVNAAPKAERPNHRVKAAWEPAGSKAENQAEAPAGVRVKAKAPDKAVAGSHNK
jgi:uncharacterized protein (DUF2342 family)